MLVSGTSTSRTGHVTSGVAALVLLLPAPPASALACASSDAGKGGGSGPSERPMSWRTCKTGNRGDNERGGLMPPRPRKPACCVVRTRLPSANHLSSASCRRHFKACISRMTSSRGSAVSSVISAKRRKGNGSAVSVHNERAGKHSASPDTPRTIDFLVHRALEITRYYAGVRCGAPRKWWGQFHALCRWRGGFLDGTARDTLIVTANDFNIFFCTI